MEVIMKHTNFSLIMVAAATICANTNLNAVKLLKQDNIKILKTDSIKETDSKKHDKVIENALYNDLCNLYPNPNKITVDTVQITETITELETVYKDLKKAWLNEAPSVEFQATFIEYVNEHFHNIFKLAANKLTDQSKTTITEKGDVVLSLDGIAPWSKAWEKDFKTFFAQINTPKIDDAPKSNVSSFFGKIGGKAINGTKTVGGALYNAGDYTYNSAKNIGKIASSYLPSKKTTVIVGGVALTGLALADYYLGLGYSQAAIDYAMSFWKSAPVVVEPTLYEKACGYFPGSKQIADKMNSIFG